jgi:hypothetical protein
MMYEVITNLGRTDKQYYTNKIKALESVIAKLGEYNTRIFQHNTYDVSHGSMDQVTTLRIYCDTAASVWNVINEYRRMMWEQFEADVYVYQHTVVKV